MSSLVMLKRVGAEEEGKGAAVSSRSGTEKKTHLFFEKLYKHTAVFALILPL